jgi:hypothetical protein
MRIAFLAIPFHIHIRVSCRAHDGNRTHDPTLTKGVLYRLSYVGRVRAASRSLLPDTILILPHFANVSNSSPTTVKCRCIGALDEGGKASQVLGRCCPPGGVTTTTGGYAP